MKKQLFTKEEKANLKRPKELIDKKQTKPKTLTIPRKWKNPEIANRFL